MSGYGETQEEAQNVTAFRAAEKKYQLHLEQQMRYRGGRIRGGKLVAQATDLSEVIDIRNTSAASTQSAFQSHQLPAEDCVQLHLAQPCQSKTLHRNAQQPYVSCTSPQQQQQGQGGTTVLTFPAHPGLAVFPGALEPLQQLQLMRAALESWPNPPARTNHTKVFGYQLAGLYAAAQAGLSLTQQPSQQPAQADSSVAGSTAPQASNCSSNNCCNSHESQQQQQAQHHSSAVPPSPAPAAAGYSRHHVTSCCRQDERCCSRHSCSSCWSPQGKGPKAAVLLRKLRWASLGPPFNWTGRVYDHHVEHTPLPAELARIASTYAALAAEAGRSSSSHSSITRDASSLDNSTTNTAVPGTVQQPPQQQPEAPFRPDVALVNYYHAGDTLGGHKDDVEPDRSQPIVTMSLGCDAVFLMGGQSRDEQPTALLLRSGDVVVLGGPARSSYHGVPRIFSDRPLPDDLDAVVEQHEELRPYFEYFKQCRVNVSVRMVV